MSYDMHDVLRAVVDAGELDEFQGELAREMICADARIAGIPVGVIANQRGLIKGRAGEKPRFGGILYAESAEKVAFYIDGATGRGSRSCSCRTSRASWSAPRPSTRGSSARARASSRRWRRARAEARADREPRVGCRLLRDGGQGFDPDFIFSWPTGRMGVMEGESADPGGARPAIEPRAQGGRALPPDVQQAVEEMRADYEHQLDARFAAARGFVDAIVHPEETRTVLATALRAALQNPGPHLGAFALPTTV
jgi:acetyl-CoA carboxylase carboxyltransferase component